MIEFLMTTPGGALCLLIGAFAICIFLGVPIAFALIAGTLACIILLGSFPMAYIAQTFFVQCNSFPLLAIPFFVLAGDIMLKGGVSKRLVGLFKTLIGHVKGSLAIVSVLTSMIFASLSGSGPATTAAVGGIMIPEMKKDGYDIGFACSLSAAGGAMGPIIPPSIAFVVYSVLSGVSIGDMFIAGVLPGVCMAIVLCVLASVACRRYNYGTQNEHASSLKKIWIAFKAAFWSLLVPVFILGGIYGGFVTPTEAAVIACDYALIVGFFIYKELKIKDLWPIFKNSAVTSSIVIILIGTAAGFSKILTMERITTLCQNFILGVSDEKWVILLLINIVFLIAGMFLETTAALLIFTPLLIPVVTAIDVNLIHFGIFMMVNLVIGMCTPPVGINMFVAAGVGKIKVERMMKWNYICILCLIVALMVYS